MHDSSGFVVGILFALLCFLVCEMFGPAADALIASVHGDEELPAPPPEGSRDLPVVPMPIRSLHERGMLYWSAQVAQLTMQLTEANTKLNYHTSRFRACVRQEMVAEHGGVDVPNSQEDAAPPVEAAQPEQPGECAACKKKREKKTSNPGVAHAAWCPHARPRKARRLAEAGDSVGNAAAAGSG